MQDKLGKTRTVLAQAREAWLIFGVSLLLLLALEATLSLAYAIRDWVGTSTASKDWRIRADAYSGSSWVQQYYNEFEESSVTRWSSYVYWRRKPYQGQHITVDPNGIRRTWTANEDRRGQGDRCSIFVFGGSTIWGVGARDDATIPSFLARKLQEQGIQADVTNFGESGYVSTQEVIALARELQNGHIPDLVIFYDGVNDVYSAYQQHAAGLPHNEYNRVNEFNLTQLNRYRSLRTLFLQKTAENLTVVRFSKGLLRRLGVGRGQPDAAFTYWRTNDISSADREVLQQETPAIYESNVRLIMALADTYNFKTLLYWQPTIFDKKNLTAYEETQRKSVEDLQPFCQAVYDLVCRGDRLEQYKGVFRDLSGTFAEISQPVFIDWCHLSEWGNEVIAGQMAIDMARLCRVQPGPVLSRTGQSRRIPHFRDPRQLQSQAESTRQIVTRSHL